MRIEKKNQKDWTGNKNSVFALAGVNRNPETRAYRDLYTTPREAVEKLLIMEKFSNKIWEPASGLLHISSVLENHGFEVLSTDIEARMMGIEKMDFLEYSGIFDGDIITNPPYSIAELFVRKSIEVVTNGHKVAMLLRINFLEGQKRRELFDKFPPIRIYVFSKRINCPKNGLEIGQHSTMCFAWFVWQKGFQCNPTIYWI